MLSLAPSEQGWIFLLCILATNGYIITRRHTCEQRLILLYCSFNYLWHSVARTLDLGLSVPYYSVYTHTRRPTVSICLKLICLWCMMFLSEDFFFFCTDSKLLNSLLQSFHIHTTYFVKWACLLITWLVSLFQSLCPFCYLSKTRNDLLHVLCCWLYHLCSDSHLEMLSASVAKLMPTEFTH